MPDRFGGRQRAVEQGVDELLSELASYLVAAGISSSRFMSLARLAYFRAASTRARFGNKRLNQSAVAAMTGLTRVQVRQFAKQPKAAQLRVQDRIDHVIDGWLTDVAFTGQRQAPLPLRATGRGRTFAALVRKYGGDIPSRSVLREMQRHGLVAVRGGMVSLRKEIRETANEFRLRQISRALAEAIKSSGDPGESASAMRALNIEVTYPTASDKGRHMLHRRTAAGLRTFVEGIRAAGLAASIDSPPKIARAGVVSRARILLITEDVRNQQS